MKEILLSKPSVLIYKQMNNLSYYTPEKEVYAHVEEMIKL